MAKIDVDLFPYQILANFSHSNPTLKPLHVYVSPRTHSTYLYFEDDARRWRLTVSLRLNLLHLFDSRVLEYDPVEDTYRPDSPSIIEPDEAILFYNEKSESGTEELYVQVKKKLTMINPGDVVKFGFINPPITYEQLITQCRQYLSIAHAFAKKII